MKKISIIFIALLISVLASSQAVIINHNCVQIKQIPESAILAAKQKLHIAYGHTSHGSQLTDGMSGLVSFMNGLGYPNNLYMTGQVDLSDQPKGLYLMKISGSSKTFVEKIIIRK